MLAAEVSPPTGTSELEADLDIINRSDAHARINGMFAILDAADASRAEAVSKRSGISQVSTTSLAVDGPASLRPAHAPSSCH